MRRNVLRLVLPLALSALACEGQIDDPFANDPSRSRWGGDVGGLVPESALRRLSPLEAEATVRDLLAEHGVTAAIPAAPLPTPDHRHGFQNALETGHLSFGLVQGIVEWAESISALATANVERSLGCTPGPSWDGCVSGFATNLMRLAFRRPLDADERARLESIYIEVAREATPVDGVRALWELAIVSPDFWYVSAETVPGGTQLAPHAIASHLAYGLWGTMPDAWLRERTESLTSSRAVREVAEVMLDDPRSEATVTRFHRDWLNLASASQLDKDRTLYPTFDAALARDLETELDAFVTRAVLDGHEIGTVFASRDAYVNRRLEQLYGLSPMSSGDDDWVWRELGPERAGILTRPLFLASTAGRGESSLIHRGVAVIEHLLCRTLAAPPNAIEEAVAIPPEASSGKLLGVSDRASKPQCSTCHDTIDPLGLAFESFDAIGAFRTAYPDGVPIDPAGRLDATFLSAPIVYESSAELLAELARAPEVQLCYAAKWSEWLTGRRPNRAQSDELERIAEAADRSIRDLILETIASPLFLDRVEPTR
ncbi:MAG: DUF1592 domain-containing protein [Myxococcales bacterium]|nr:DUF1592 domain-containing protein [Myxococcales bacterium]